MKQAFIYVEGQDDAALLRRILPPDLLHVCELIVAGSKSRIATLARSVLVYHKRPIVAVMDADSVNAATIEEQHQTILSLIMGVPGIVPVKVILVVPTIEAWLLAAPEALGRVLGRELSATEVAAARRDPPYFLQAYAASSGKMWDTQQALAMLDADDIQRIRSLPDVAELTAFLQAAKQAGQAA